MSTLKVQVLYTTTTTDFRKFSRTVQGTKRSHYSRLFAIRMLINSRPQFLKIGTVIAEIFVHVKIPYHCVRYLRYAKIVRSARTMLHTLAHVHGFRLLLNFELCLKCESTKLNRIQKLCKLQYCNRRNFRTQFNFVLFVLKAERKKLVAYENHACITVYATPSSLYANL